jgi:hypothetical protein
MKDIKVELARLRQGVKTLSQMADLLVMDKQVRILSDYNGQPYGRSRCSLRGQIMTVERAHIDPHWGVFLFLRGERVLIREDEVEWL